jgi:hypothetical protein
MYVPPGGSLRQFVHYLTAQQSTSSSLYIEQEGRIEENGEEKILYLQSLI